jgi:hypothetical protein
MLVAFISWWYGKGFVWKSERILSGIERSINTFSLGLLLKTWFAPFRQIDAVGVSGGALDAYFLSFFIICKCNAEWVNKKENDYICTNYSYGNT